MSRTVTGFRNVAVELQNRWGIKVKDVPGWETRGRGVLDPKGLVRHHTASPKSSGTYGSLRVVTYGRSDLRNALCNWYQPREAAGRELWIVAAGLAWHAGQGGWKGLSGNGSVIGLEAENDGVGEPWGLDQWFCAIALDVELAREFGYAPKMGCEHKEWSPRRKVDRKGIDGDQWRAEVFARTNALTNEEDEMLFIRQKGTHKVWAVIGGKRFGMRKPQDVQELLPPEKRSTWGTEVRDLAADHPVWSLPSA